MMTEKKMESFLYGVFEALAFGESDELPEILAGALYADGESGGDSAVEASAVLRDFRWDTFEEKGVLTRDRGLVVSFGDGREFQLTVVRSRSRPARRRR